ncbi:nuclear transport factor 2 family protein [Burkholderia plantarii]|uniref:nuclear transport factor 2 family protein n=1 Tax=Burkholderia plantarii TaxID=41899 RepID=UPI00272D4EDE|nr:nuclear transport factor 2 family protein [Burkholderia plantarii]
MMMRFVIRLLPDSRRALAALALSALCGAGHAQTPAGQRPGTAAADVVEIQNVVAQYVATLDADTVGEPVASRVERFTRLFTSDGVWTEHLWNAGRPADDGPGCLVRGAAQLTRFAQVLFGSASAPAATTRHNLVSPLVEIAGDRATAAANWLQTRDATQSSGIVELLATGRYYLNLRRQGSGWVIEKLDLMSDHPLYGTPLGPPCTATGPR